MSSPQLSTQLNALLLPAANGSAVGQHCECPDRRCGGHSILEAVAGFALGPLSEVDHTGQVVTLVTLGGEGYLSRVDS